MAATQRPTGAEDDPNQSSMDELPPPSPDEDGPHDVPDDKVIEKTLPTARTGHSGEGRSPNSRG